MNRQLSDDASHPSALSQFSRSSASLELGKAKFQAHLEITPAALLGIGGMVGLILLAVAPIVRAAASVRANEK